MILSKGLTRLGSIVAVTALVLGLGLSMAATANAQVPALFYGTGLTAGATVEARAGDVVCGTATADATGGWSIQIGPDGECAVPGTEIMFFVDGEQADQVATFQVGTAPGQDGNPGDRATGIALTFEGADDGGEEPTPPDTGNAGLAVDGGMATGMALVLGVVALGAVAGARVATGRSR